MSDSTHEWEGHGFQVQNAWMGVVSAEHAAYGASRGWIQLNDGKKGNLKKIRQGDGFVFYSPSHRRGETDGLRSVTQIGLITDQEPYLAHEVMDMGPKGAVQPWRRRVQFFDVRAISIHQLDLELTQRKSWGYSLRLGLVPLSLADYLTMLKAITGKMSE